MPASIRWSQSSKRSLVSPANRLVPGKTVTAGDGNALRRQLGLYKHLLSHQPMPVKNESSLRQALIPAVSSSYKVRVGEETVLLLLQGKPREFLTERVIHEQEAFFTVEHGRVFALTIVQAFKLPRAHAQLDRPEQGGMGVFFEVRICQVGNLPREPVDLDQVRPFDLPEELRDGRDLVGLGGGGDLPQRDPFFTGPGADDVQRAEAFGGIVRPATGLAVDRHEAFGRRYVAAVGSSAARTSPWRGHAVCHHALPS